MYDKNGNHLKVGDKIKARVHGNAVMIIRSMEFYFLHATDDEGDHGIGYNQHICAREVEKVFSEE